MVQKLGQLIVTGRELEGRIVDKLRFIQELIDKESEAHAASIKAMELKPLFDRWQSSYPHSRTERDRLHAAFRTQAAALAHVRLKIEDDFEINGEQAVFYKFMELPPDFTCPKGPQKLPVAETSGKK